MIDGAMVNWKGKLDAAEQLNSKLDYNETAAKAGNLLALKDEILAEQSIEGIIAISSLASSLDRYDKGKAEELELLVLSRVRDQFPSILLPTLLQLGCFYSKHEELKKAKPYFDEAFKILKAQLHTQKTFEKINDNSFVKWILGILRMSKFIAANAEWRGLIDSCLKECRGFYVKSENPDAVREIENILNKV